MFCRALYWARGSRIEHRPCFMMLIAVDCQALPLPPLSYSCSVPYRIPVETGRIWSLKSMGPLRYADNAPLLHLPLNLNSNGFRAPHAGKVWQGLNWKTSILIISLGELLIQEYKSSNVMCCESSFEQPIIWSFPLFQPGGCRPCSVWDGALPVTLAGWPALFIHTTHRL